MTKTYSSPKRAPAYVLHRDVAVVDSADSEVYTEGINMGGFRFANIQVIAKASQNPTVEVMFWSDEADKFIKGNDSLMKTGIGAAIPYEFTVEANSRVIWIKVTIGTAKIFVSGWDEEYR